MRYQRGVERCGVVAVGLATLLCGACIELTAEEAARLAQMELTAEDLPPSPTNDVADDPAAAELGRQLFFDVSMSSDGRVGCVSCHDPEQGWSDDRTVSLGVEDRAGARHSMPITVAAHQRFLLWDGRADSLWSQALKAIENPKEMDFTRTEVAHFIAQSYPAAYEDVFGELPDLADVPTRAEPDSAAWSELSESQREAVDRVFSNVGKALEAYERRVSCTDTRFDRWTRNEVELTRKEEIGAAKFLRDGCVNCHSGPTFSDGKFHNIGIGSGTDVPDRGRTAGAPELLEDPFNGEGSYSDDVDFGAAKLGGVDPQPHHLGAFRTPSLRGVGQRKSFGHRGHKRDLRAFLDDMYDDAHLHGSAVGVLDEEVRGIDLERSRTMVAFLKTLNCPDPDDALLAP